MVRYNSWTSAASNSKIFLCHLSYLFFNLSRAFDSLDLSKAVDSEDVSFSSIWENISLINSCVNNNSQSFSKLCSDKGHSSSDLSNKNVLLVSIFGELFRDSRMF